LELVNVVDRKLATANHLAAVHDFDQPTPGRLTLVSEKDKSLPSMPDRTLRVNHSVLDNEYLPRFRNLADTNIASNPAGAPRCGGQRFSLFDQGGRHELLGNNKEILYRFRR
jgi:hypothetical protein